MKMMQFVLRQIVDQGRASIKLRGTPWAFCVLEGFNLTKRTF